MLNRYIPHRSAETLANAEPRGHPDRVSNVATGLGRIGLAERGSGGVPILFLHGVGSDKSVWAPQLAHFGSNRRAVAFDYPGYGESTPAAEGTTRDDYATAILAAMDALGIGRTAAPGAASASRWRNSNSPAGVSKENRPRDCR